MASTKPIVPLQQNKGEAEAGERQVKVVKMQGNNRRALGDIGNMVTVRGVEGKGVEGKQKQLAPQYHRPLTRSFCAQLLQKAQATAVENNNNKIKPVKVVADGVMVGKAGAAVKPAVPKKVVTIKPQPDQVIEINKDKAGAAGKPAVPKKVVTIKPQPDQVIEINKDKAETPRASPHSVLKKKVHTFTAVLSARSKVACGVTSKPKEPIVNIDAADVDNHLAAVEYVDDLYKFYKLEEGSSRVHDYMDSQPEMNQKMRAILVDWLIEVHNKFQLTPETLYLTINIVDRYLSMKIVPRKELQLAGMSAMLIASKYEEIWAPEVNDFVCISDMAYTREQVLVMEKSILGKLEWNLTVPTPYVFLVRFIKAAVSDQEMESMVFYLAELGLLHYGTTMYCPSMVAASAVYVARCTLNKSPLWTGTLKLHTGFSESQLMDCAKLLAKYQSGAAENKLQAIYKKYSNPQRHAVALLPPAKNLLA